MTGPGIAGDVSPGDAVQLRRKLNPKDLAEGIVASQQQGAALARSHIHESETLIVQLQPVPYRLHHGVKHRGRYAKVTVVVGIVLMAGRQFVEQPAGIYAEALIERVHRAIAAVFTLLHAGPLGLLSAARFAPQSPDAYSSPNLFQMASTRVRVVGSMAIICGHGRLKPSAFHLRVASMPILLP